MNKRTKTQSKHWYDDEIHHIDIGADGEKIIHLHEWVHRTYNPYLLDYNRISHRNEYLDIEEKHKKAMKILFGSNDFEEESFD